MAESPEHQFLSALVVDVLERTASTGLYTFLENERRRFDFGCMLERDWTRPIVGQTLWKHVEGVDKDLRTLLADEAAEVCIYVARDTIKARNIWHEAVTDFRGISELRVHRLRSIWIPSDFDADIDDQRTLVSDLIAYRVSRDVLLNVILGNLTADACRLFVSSTGLIGLDLALLQRIATEGFTNLTSLARSTGVSAGTIRERLARLAGCRFLNQPGTISSYFHATLSGRVFLELCREISHAEPTVEMQRVLDLLEMNSVLPDSVSGVDTQLDALRLRIDAASDQFGVSLEELNYHPYWESDAWPPSIRRPERPWT